MKDRDLSALRVAISGGAPIPAEVLDEFERTFGLVVLEGYGLSETASTTTFNASAEDRRVYSVGKPIWGVELEIRDAQERALPAGRDHVGEIVVRGVNVMRGYHGNPAATAEAIVDGWLHTGDLGYVDEDGFVFVVDRKKELIIRGGYNVYPREVENVLYSHPAVAEAAVVGVADARLGQEVVRPTSRSGRAARRRRSSSSSTSRSGSPPTSTPARWSSAPYCRRTPPTRSSSGSCDVVDRMNPLDAAFLQLEDSEPGTSLAIASTAVFDGPAPSTAEFTEMLTGRLALIPRYRQKARQVPLDLGPPVWVDDEHFDIGYHVRRTALPAPGGDAELSALMARVMSARLDRARPLWEYWLVEGLAGGRFALISKVHHCMVDGVSGTDLYNVVLDPTPTPRPPTPDDWRPEHEPSELRLAAAAVGELGRKPAELANALVRSLRAPGGLPDRLGDAARGAVTLATALWPARASSLSGPLSAHRRFAFSRGTVADINAVRKAFGGTFNDVVLAAVTGGFRDLILGRGEEPASDMVRTLVPVSVRAPGTEDVRNNQVSMMLALLPVEIAEPVPRLTAVTTRLAQLKDAHEAETGAAADRAGRHRALPRRRLPGAVAGPASAAVGGDRHDERPRPPGPAVPVGTQAARDRSVRADRLQPADRRRDLQLPRPDRLRGDRRLRQQRRRRSPCARDRVRPPRPRRAGPHGERRPCAQGAEGAEGAGSESLTPRGACAVGGESPPPAPHRSSTVGSPGPARSASRPWSASQRPEQAEHQPQRTHERGARR